jgi:hypothetical protein
MIYVSWKRHTILKIHEWDEALNQVARHLVHTLLLKILVLMINEKRVKGKSSCFCKIRISYPIRTRFYCSVLCSGTAIKVPLLAIISTQP